MFPRKAPPPNPGHTWYNRVGLLQQAWSEMCLDWDRSWGGVPNRLLEVPGQPSPGVVRGCSLTARGLSHDATAWKSIVNVQGPNAVRGAHAC